MGYIRCKRVNKYRAKSPKSVRCSTQLLDMSQWHILLLFDCEVPRTTIPYVYCAIETRSDRKFDTQFNCWYMVKILAHVWNVWHLRLETSPLMEYFDTQFECWYTVKILAHIWNVWHSRLKTFPLIEYFNTQFSLT